MGLPEPYETVETYLTGLSSARRQQLTTELVSAFAGSETPAALHRQGAGRRGWHEVSRGTEAVAGFLDLFGSDDWWAGEVVLLVRGRSGPALFFPSSDAELYVVVVGGYRSRQLRQEVTDLVAKALPGHGRG